MDAAELRAAFPVLERTAYLNAGTDGPLPAAAAGAAGAELARELAEGRAKAHFERRSELARELRAAYADALGAGAADVALTTSTSDGIVRVLAGLELRAGDEIVTSDSEHPGLLGPLSSLRRAGVTVRAVPLADVADAAGPATALVACSHVNWLNGELAPTAALAALEVPVLLDGAQGVGALDVGVERLGCDFYAGSGQKWLCGPDGTGMLWVAPEARARLDVPAAGYLNLTEPSAGLDAVPWPDARAFDAPSIAAEVHAAALASARLLAAFGWAALWKRARAGAQALASALRERGLAVAPRGDTTLVSWASETAEEDAARLGEAGVLVRFLPGRGLVRASVGAWSDEQDRERLLAAL